MEDESDYKAIVDKAIGKKSSIETSEWIKEANKKLWVKINENLRKYFTKK